MNSLNGYELSRTWFDFAFENPDKVRPAHTALYFFCIEHCNRLGWKKKFGLPTTMAKEAIGIKSYNTYINTLNDLVDWKFLTMVEKSKNQFSSNIIALSKFDKALDKALDKAMIKHASKQRESIDSIIKQLNKEQLTSEQGEMLYQILIKQNIIPPPDHIALGHGPDKNEVLRHFASHGIKDPKLTKMAKSFYTKWDATNWSMNGSKIKNWTALANRFIYNWEDIESKQDQTNNVNPAYQPKPLKDVSVLMREEEEYRQQQLQKRNHG